MALTIHLTYMYYVYLNKFNINFKGFIIRDDKGNEVFDDVYEDVDFIWRWSDIHLYVDTDPKYKPLQFCMFKCYSGKLINGGPP